MGAIHRTKIQNSPTGKRGPPQKVDQFFRNFSGWTEPIHWVLDRNFRKFWLNGSRPIFSVARGQVLRRQSTLLESLSSSTQCAYFSLLCWPLFDDEVSFFCLCNTTWLARDSKLQPIKITQFFVKARNTRKLKNKRQFLTPKKNTKGMRSGI